MKQTALKFIKQNFLIILLVIYGSLLYGFRFDYPTLSSWDEAWYASISREMIRSGEFFEMDWNNGLFIDHPPMGMWITALSYSILGINEFSTRLPSVIMGVLSLVLMYQIGVLLFKKKFIGFAAALILSTCVWYVIRVRSGNLDAAFNFFYLLTVYLTLKAETKFKWFPLATASFGALMLTKTLVGISALPLMIFIVFKQLIKIKQNWKIIILSIASFSVVTLPWYVINYNASGDFMELHFFKIGTRNKTLASYFQLLPEQPLFYLHMGVRKWYDLWLLSSAFLLVSFKFLKKNVAVILLWNLFILYPFLTSTETHIWHLIPVYLPLSLIVAYGLYELGMFAVSVSKKIPLSLIKTIHKKFINETVINSAYIVVILVITFLQIKTFYPEVYPTEKFTPDDVDVSRKAGTYNKKIYLDDDYLPLAVYYSGSYMQQMNSQIGYSTMVDLFKSNEQDFIIITRNWAVNGLEENNLEYNILYKNNSFSILEKKL